MTIDDQFSDLLVLNQTIMDSISSELQTVIYATGDCREGWSEDQILNALIGMQELCNKRKEMMRNAIQTLEIATLVEEKGS
jgi:hypothetical protein